MEEYLMNSLFASNLLEYLFQKLQFPWENPYASMLSEDCQRSQFDVEMSKSIHVIGKKNEKEFEACYMELRKEGVDDKETFSKYAVSAADSFFSNGYSHESFLGYCAIVLGVATFYYEYPLNGVPEMAVEVVAFVLFAHQLTGQFYRHDGWDGLRKTSRIFNIVCEKTCSEMFEEQNKI